MILDILVTVFWCLWIKWKFLSQVSSFQSCRVVLLTSCELLDIRFFFLEGKGLPFEDLRRNKWASSLKLLFYCSHVLFFFLCFLYKWIRVYSMWCIDMDTVLLGIISFLKYHLLYMLMCCKVFQPLLITYMPWTLEIVQWFYEYYVIKWFYNYLNCVFTM